ncbi:alpha-hydroxy-acid oxidizing protein [Aquabacterium lacunae]|uniref:Alpha-hydroxy-acid oxidizing protein n=1 Tax=Aquabacterium lacunae TaxID=2528630 RepID=A0A4Q9H1E6_9BURK|nr:alpha-hydroxy acid oxidase [Aquabacterium lacunae]TBO30289.1 alpha-hydroxy-acid oxidizing protein [Aquabacterium lacunae]
MSPATGRIPPDVASLADYERHALQRLDAARVAWLQGGAADGLTVQANQRAWQGLPLQPRVLRPLAHGHTRIERPGLRLPHPIMLAPVAYLRLVHPDGELATAMAAAAQGAGLVLSTQASVPMERVAELVLGEAERGPLWFQLYAMAQREHTLQLVQRAEAAGFEALVLTVDAPVQGARDAERRAGFRLPADVRAVNLQGLALPGMAAADAAAPGLAAGLCGGLLAHAPTWSDIAWLKAHTRLPLWLKGITHPLDAQQAQALGVDGLIVSNHGGRVLDTMPATAALLPAVRQAVGPEWPVLVDGGIRRGTDVLKALALGADAVLVGRPHVHALAVAGALGVAHAIRLLRDEFEIALALTGCATPAEVSSAVLSSAVLTSAERGG